MALTFDDGPAVSSLTDDRPSTVRVLETLADNSVQPGIKAIFFNADDGYREATLLTIRLLYWYELRIPLADLVVWSAWAAAVVPAVIWVQPSRVPNRPLGLKIRISTSSR